MFIILFFSQKDKVFTFKILNMSACFQESIGNIQVVEEMLEVSITTE